MSTMTRFETSGFAVISPSDTPVLARKKLAAAKTETGIVFDASRPAALVADRQLQAVEHEQRPLSELLSQLPSLTLVEDVDMTREMVRRLADHLDSSGGAGLVVYRDGKVQGVVSERAFLDALPVDLISSSVTRGAGGTLFGYPGVPAYAFVCPVCHSHSYPRKASPPPICPRDGMPMEPDKEAEG